MFLPQPKFVVNILRVLNKTLVLDPPGLIESFGAHNWTARLQITLTVSNWLLGNPPVFKDPPGENEDY